MAAELHVDVVTVERDFTTRFASDLSTLLELMGKVGGVEMLPKGGQFHVYKSAGTLNTTQVAAGAEINASTYDYELDHDVTVAINKYRKITGIEKIQAGKEELALISTNDAMLRDVQNVVRTSIFNGIKAGTGTATGSTFQKAAANAWGALSTIMNGEYGGKAVFFAHPNTVAGYLGDAAITLQEKFGLSYIENFLGMGNVIVDSNVTENEIWATCEDNINIVAPEIVGEVGETDETGLVSVSVNYKPENAGYQTVILSGVACVPSFLDRVIKATISA